LKVDAQLLDIEKRETHPIQSAVITDAVKPFADCLSAFQGGTTTTSLSAQDDVAAVDIPLVVPGKLGGGDPTEGIVTVCARVVPASFKMRDRVAYSRGFGMVVRYRDLSGISLSARPFVAVVVAGTLRGLTAADETIETFLRLSEPPEHHEWTSNQRLQSAYKKGYAKALEKLEKDIFSSLRALVSAASVEGEAGPDLLSAMFPIGTHGHSEREHSFAVSKRSADLDGNDMWKFGGQVKRTKGSGNWRVRVALRLGTEDGTDVSIVDTIATKPRLDTLAVDKGVAVIEVPGSVDVIDFKGTGGAQLHFEARRTCVLLEVSAGTDRTATQSNKAAGGPSA